MTSEITKSSIGLISRLLKFLKHPLQISQKKRAAARKRVPTLPLYKRLLIESNYLLVKVFSITANL